MPRRALDIVLDHVRAEPSRTWSIIISLYGDAIVPRGGSVWLGTLLAFFTGMEVAEGVVRTAMSRLAADGWLERTRVGRNSFYRLAEKGRDTFARATAHIYRHRAPSWGGHFEMVLLEPGAREGARAMLEAAGFGMASPGLFIAPAGTHAPLDAAAGLPLSVSGTREAQQALAARAWRLDETAEGYRRFIAVFTPLARALEAGARLGDLDALIARVLLIHEYRRVVLRDPVLPAEVLPADWPGAEARALCAVIYPRLLDASERWLDENAVGEDGAPLPASREIRNRFKD